MVGNLRNNNNLAKTSIEMEIQRNDEEAEKEESFQPLQNNAIPVAALQSSAAQVHEANTDDDIESGNEMLKLEFKVVDC